MEGYEDSEGYEGWERQDGGTVAGGAWRRSRSNFNWQIVLWREERVEVDGHAR